MFLHSFSCLSHYFSFNFYQHVPKNDFKGKRIGIYGKTYFAYRNYPGIKSCGMCGEYQLS
jgi:hypothetical protein